MKYRGTIWAAVLVLFNLAANSPGLHAQTNGGEGLSRTNFPPSRVGSPESQLAAYSKALDLTSDQRAQIKVILDDSQKKRREIRKDAALSQPERRAKSVALLKEVNDKIRELLTDAQKVKWDAMQKHRRRTPAA